MRRENAGFSLMELLAAVLVLSVALAAVVVVFATHSRAYLRADTEATMEANLRLGMNMVTEALRNAKYGAPTANLSSWITWVSGFTSNPAITTNGTNASQLLRNENRGSGTQAAVENITNLQVTTVTAGTEYDLTLTARSPQVDALTRQYFTTSLRSKVTLAN